MRKVLYPHMFINQCDSHYVKLAVLASEGLSFPALEKSPCCLCDPMLLSSVHIFLRRSLDAFPAGLDLYKMYSIRIDGNDIDFKMARSPVPFNYPLAKPCQIFTCKIFPDLP